MSEPYIRNNNNHLTTMKKDQINLVIPLPQALEKYSSIYNKNGRIGIYTREVNYSLLLYLFIYLLIYFFITIIFLLLLLGKRSYYNKIL